MLVHKLVVQAARLNFGRFLSCRRAACTTIGALLATAAYLLLGNNASEGQPDSKLVQTGPTRLYFGVKACVQCHTTPMEKDVLLCRCNEFPIWDKQDKHRHAHKVLTGEQGRQIARNLGMQADVAREPACISCHGVLVEDEKLIHRPSFSLEDGVGCAVCHGPYKEWVSKHADFLEREHWRSLSRATKETRHGMKDLWDPVKRATLCASCHIGNTAEGKVVTHAMYAAGHPPLPGIEMATFSDAMPRHWEYLAEKKPQVQKMLDYDPARGDLEKTQFVVIASLVSFRESMNLLASQAEQGVTAMDRDKRWPELALFDCYACHHELKSDSWRLKRGYQGTPGRPHMRPWPAVLVHLGMAHAGKIRPETDRGLAQSMQFRMKDLVGAFDARPFGDADRIAKAARQMSLWTDDLLGKVSATRFDRPAARHLLSALGRLPAQGMIDFDSARQMAWAYRTIQAELDPALGRDPDIGDLLKSLNTQLQLDLPPGQVEIGKDYLKEALQKLSDHDPERFRRTFDLLVQKTERSVK